MQSIPWRSTCRLRNHLFNTVYSAQFHSTPVLSAKGRRKWDECKYGERDKKPSKSYMKYVGRQNRAERKKALKNYLHNGKTSKFFEHGRTGTISAKAMGTSLTVILILLWVQVQIELHLSCLHLGL
ncbi:uncharacterized protein LOC144559008 isoform X1 [Carex rostrata]